MLPFFFVETISADGATQVLSEETSRHIVQVLRMKKGDALRLADGRGKLATAIISDDHKKKCQVSVSGSSVVPRPALQNTVAISLLKNNTRLEWFLEKAAELGVSKIVPLICTRTEKQHFRFDRMNAILISAMLQSQQSWLTELAQPVAFKDFVLREFGGGTGCFIAHCEEGEKSSMRQAGEKAFSQRLILIGPEGDFTTDEIAMATANGFQPVELGKTRLRTETAGVVAATLLQLG